MRLGIWVILALVILVVGAGLLVLTVGWLAPAVNASATTLPVDSSVNSTTASSTSVDPVQPMNTSTSLSGDDTEFELTTFSQGQHFCDGDKASSSAGY